MLSWASASARSFWSDSRVIDGGGPDEAELGPGIGDSQFFRVAGAVDAADVLAGNRVDQVASGKQFHGAVQGKDAVVLVLRAGRQPGHPEGKQQDENRGREAEGADIGFPGPQPAAEGQEMQKFVAQIDEGAEGPKGQHQSLKPKAYLCLKVN